MVTRNTPELPPDELRDVAPGERAKAKTFLQKHWGKLALLLAIPLGIYGLGRFAGAGGLAKAPEWARGLGANAATFSRAVNRVGSTGWEATKETGQAVWKGSKDSGKVAWEGMKRTGRSVTNDPGAKDLREAIKRGHERPGIIEFEDKTPQKLPRKSENETLQTPLEDKVV